MPTLNLMSKSNRFYFELSGEYDLKPLDAIVLNYLINAFKKSVSYGKSGSNGKCFYRNDGKVTGFYWATTLSKLQNDIPCHIGSITTLEKSLGRLQNKYGFIYKHQTIRTKNNGIQIFIPLLDLAVRYDLGDNSYKTVINCKDGSNVKNCMIDMLKTNISFYQKLLYRYVRNCKNNNHHINKQPVINNHLSNCVYSNSAENKFSDTINKTNSSLGLSIDSLNIISRFCNKYDKGYNGYKTIINKIIQVGNSVAKKFNLNKDNKLINFKESPYFSSDYFTNDLKSIFKQVQHNTKHNQKTPNVNHYLGYFVDHLKYMLSDYLEDHYSLKPQHAKRTYREHRKNNQTPRKTKLSKEDKELLESDDQYFKNHKLHQTPKSLQRKIRKQLNELNHKDGFGNKHDIKTGKSTNESSNEGTHKKLVDGTSIKDLFTDSKPEHHESTKSNHEVTNDIVKSDFHRSMKLEYNQVYPKVADSDLYTVMKSNLPDKQLLITNIHLYPVSVKQLRSKYKPRNCHINNDLLITINKYIDLQPKPLAVGAENNDFDVPF